MIFNRLRVHNVLPALLVSMLLGACGGENPDALIASARQYLEKNDSKAAVIQSKNALRINPNSPEARFLLGTALLNGGDPLAAEVEFRKALELKHPQDLVMPALARALLMQGQHKKLTDEFTKTELNEPTARADFLTSFAYAYAAQGRAGQSQAALKSALVADPDSLPALIAQARQRATLLDFDGALAAVDGVIAKHPDSHDAWKLKGDILYVGKNNMTEGLAAYRKAIEYKPDFLPGHFGVLTILLKQGSLDEASVQLDRVKKYAANHPQTTYLETLLAFQRKDFNVAREHAQRLLKMSPDNPKGLQLAGAVEFQSNSLLQAEVYLSKAVQTAPQLSIARRLLVMTYLRSGQPAKALATLLPALDKDNVDPQLLSVAGEAYLQNGDVKKAEEYFSKAAKLDPQNSRKRTSLALTHLIGGAEDSAFGELQDIATSDTGSTADLALISAYLRRNEFDKALKAIDALEKKQPEKPLAANLRGRTQMARKDLVAARRSFEGALAIDPGNFLAVASLAALDMAENKPAAAKKRFDDLLAKDPRNVQALLALADLGARSGAGKDEIASLLGRAVAAKPTDTASHLLLIDFHLRGKDFKKASSSAQNAIAALPGSPEIVEAMGRVQQASGELNQAIASYNKLAAMQPLSPYPHMRLAGVHLEAKNRDAAAQSLRKALEIKPDLLEAQRGLIMLNIESKKFKDALAVAGDVQKQRPTEAVGYLLEGDINAAQRNWAPSAVAYRSGLKHAPSTELALKLHAVLMASGRSTDAEQFSSTWLKEHPKDAAFILYLGDLALGQGDFKTAEGNYLAAIKLQPNNALAYNNLAWVMGKLNKEGAIAHAENAIKLMPDQPAFIDTLAMLMSDKGDYAKATELETKAMALAPEQSLFRLNLAKIHIKGGNKDLARKELDELGKLGEKFPAQVEVARLLKSL